MNIEIKKTLFFLSIMFLLFGCTPKIYEGEVYKKDHQNELIMNNWIMIGDMLTPMPTIIPETYTIYIKKADEVDGKWLTASYEVDKEFYDSVEIGELLRFSE